MTIDEIGDLDPTVSHPLNPGAWDPAARLADMDALGDRPAVVYPTLINEYLPQIADRDAATVLCRAYNDWLWDFAEATGGRLHPVAVLPLQDPAAAARRARPGHGRGFRAALVPPCVLLVAGSQRLRRGPDAPDDGPGARAGGGGHQHACRSSSRTGPSARSSSVARELG